MAEDEVIRTVGEALSAMCRILCSVRSVRKRPMALLYYMDVLIFHLACTAHSTAGYDENIGVVHSNAHPSGTETYRGTR